MGAAATPPSAVGVVVAGAASSVALTTSLEPLIFEAEGNITLEADDVLVLPPATLRDKRKPEAADAMLLVAMNE